MTTERSFICAAKNRKSPAKRVRNKKGGWQDDRANPHDNINGRGTTQSLEWKGS